MAVHEAIGDLTVTMSTSCLMDTASRGDYVCKLELRYSGCGNIFLASLNLSSFTDNAVQSVHVLDYTIETVDSLFSVCVCVKARSIRVSVCALTWTVETFGQLIHSRRIAAEFLSSLPSLIVY